MKNILAIMLVLFVGTAMAQDKKVKTISFKTSAICESCKDRIEKELNYTKGVIFAEVDLEKNIVTVKYKTKVLNQDMIKGLYHRLVITLEKCQEIRRHIMHFPSAVKKKDIVNNESLAP